MPPADCPLRLDRRRVLRTGGPCRRTSNLVRGRRRIIRAPSRGGRSGARSRIIRCFVMGVIRWLNNAGRDQCPAFEFAGSTGAQPQSGPCTCASSLAGWPAGGSRSTCSEHSQSRSSSGTHVSEAAAFALRQSSYCSICGLHRSFTAPTSPELRDAAGTHHCGSGVLLGARCGRTVWRSTRSAPSDAPHTPWSSRRGCCRRIARTPRARQSSALPPARAPPALDAATWRRAANLRSRFHAAAPATPLPAT